MVLAECERQPGSLYSFQVVTNSNAQAYKVALASYSPLYDRWLETVGLKGPDAQSKLDRQLSDALEKCFTELKPRLVKSVASKLDANVAND